MYLFYLSIYILLLFLLAGTLPVIGTPTGKEFIEEMLFGYEHT